MILKIGWTRTSPVDLLIKIKGNKHLKQKRSSRFMKLVENHWKYLIISSKTCQFSGSYTQLKNFKSFRGFSSDTLPKNSPFRYINQNSEDWSRKINSDLRKYLNVRKCGHFRYFENFKIRFWIMQRAYFKFPYVPLGILGNICNKF